METLEALRDRIATTEDLQSIVRTMKSLSAVSIRQYENAVGSLRHYTRTIELGLQAVLRERPVLPEPARGDGDVIAIVFGSDHGLCGRFNEQLVDFARRRLRGEASENGSVRWLVIGFRAAARLEAEKEDIRDTLLLPGSVGGLTDTSRSVLLKLDEWQRHGALGRALLFHNRRTDAETAAPGVVQLLPLDAGWMRELESRKWTGRSLPLFTMDADRLFSSLVQQYLFVTIYRAGAESMASEHATRLATMQAAERNIKDHLEEMNNDFRRRRQQSITEELLDVISGFEVLQAPR